MKRYIVLFNVTRHISLPSDRFLWRQTS